MILVGIGKMAMVLVMIIMARVTVIVGMKVIEWLRLTTRIVGLLGGC